MNLPGYIVANLHKPFAWGSFDCVSFSAEWVRHATGINHLSGIASWSNERQALRILKKMGGLEKIMDDRFKRIHPNYAVDGDLAICDDRLCIFSGPHLVGPGFDGLVFSDRMKARCAWSL